MCTSYSTSLTLCWFRSAEKLLVVVFEQKHILFQNQMDVYEIYILLMHLLMLKGNSSPKEMCYHFFWFWAVADLVFVSLSVSHLVAVKASVADVIWYDTDDKKSERSLQEKVNSVSVLTQTHECVFVTENPSWELSLCHWPRLQLSDFWIGFLKPNFTWCTSWWRQTTWFFHQDTSKPVFLKTFLQCSLCHLHYKSKRW